MQLSTSQLRAPVEVSRGDPNARFVRMTTEPVSRLVVNLAVPTIISMLVTALYNMADTYFVGKLSTAATGAVGVVFPLMTAIQVVGMTLGVGSGSCVARLLGRKDVSRANQVVSTAFFTALACGGLMTLFGEIFSSPLMRLLGSTETILPYAKEYAAYILLGAPFVAASFVMNVNLRSEGSAVLAMIGLVSGAIINIALDPLFIFAFRMGIAGAAAATVLSQLVSFLILLSYYIRRQSALRINFKNIRTDRSMHLEIFWSGLPTFFRLSLVTLSAAILNSVSGIYGDAAIAGMTIVNRITIFIGSAMIGFGQGFQPVAAFNYTAGLYNRVHQAFWFSIKVGFWGLFIYTVGASVFAQELVRLFRDDPEVLKVGILALRFQCATLPLTAITVITNMMFQYIGQPGKALILAASRQGFMFIPAVFILSILFGLFGVQISQSVADILSFLLAIPLASSTLRRLAHKEPLQHPKRPDLLDIQEA